MGLYLFSVPNHLLHVSRVFRPRHGICAFNGIEQYTGAVSEQSEAIRPSPRAQAAGPSNRAGLAKVATRPASATSSSPSSPPELPQLRAEVQRLDPQASSCNTQIDDAQGGIVAGHALKRRIAQLCVSRLNACKVDLFIIFYYV
jgi:hypothetical protein